MKFHNILVDADILLYQVGFAVQRNVHHVWINGHEGDPSYVMSDKRKLNKILKSYEDYEIHTEVLVQPFLSASTTIDQIIDNLKKKLGTPDAEMELYLTGSGNYREEVATIQPYKGNRDQPKPVYYNQIKEYLIERYNAQVIEGQEADDMLGIRQTYFQDTGTDSIIVSIDKDLNMIPGYHYNSNKDQVYFVDETMAVQSFYSQLLQGDTADNIPGIKGIGPKTAERMISELEDITELEDRIRRAYTDSEQYDDPDQAIQEIGQLLWIRTRDQEVWYPQYRGGPVVEEYSK